MASSLYLSAICSLNSPSNNSSGLICRNALPQKGFGSSHAFQSGKVVKVLSLEVKATDSNPTTKTTTLVCQECDGNGAIVCKQCKGEGINSVDHFNGQFKAGGLCWLCRGKKEVLCGNCSGAGFVGGFMSTGDG